MYSSNPLVPLTGFGMTAGWSLMAGYPIVAVGLSVMTAVLGGLLLVRSRTRPNRPR